MPARRGYAFLVVLILTALSARVDADSAAARRVLGLLRGVEQEYQEAFDDTGTLGRPLELEEATLLLADARVQAERLADEGPADLGRRLAAVADSVKGRAPVALVTEQVRAIRVAIIETSGVAEEMFPPEPPSPARGEEIYRANCISCHGEHGAGDGPDVARSERRPADFTDPAFMRAETPADFFSVISLGRRRASMPAWEDALSVQARWDLVSYLWLLRPSAQPTPGAQRLFVAHCGACHAPGTGAREPVGRRGAPPAPLTDLERMAGRSDADVHGVITEGTGADMPGFRNVLSDEERWALVAVVRALSLGSGERRGSDHVEQVLVRVAQRVREAVDAYRLHEDDAAGLAADAYLAFEPLEPGIASHDAAAVPRVEGAFIAFQNALRQPDNMKEVEATAARVTRAIELVTEGATPAGRESSIWPLVAVVGGMMVVSLILLVSKRHLSSRG